MKPKLKILAILMFLLVIPIAYASPITEVFANGLIDINNFFAGKQYEPYATALDFFLFSILFVSVYMIGARYAFKEMRSPEKTIVILLGLLTGFLLVLAGFSIIVFLPYMHWILYLLLFLLLWWLLKKIESKSLRFGIIALILLFVIALTVGLCDYLNSLWVFFLVLLLLLILY